MNQASDLPTQLFLEFLARPAEPVADHGVPSPEACSRKQTQRSISIQDFGNEYFFYNAYIKNIISTVFVALDAGDRMRNSCVLWYESPL